MSEKEQAKKKGKMNKQVKGMICLGAVLAVLGGGFTYLKLTEPAGEESSSSYTFAPLTAAQCFISLTLPMSLTVTR